MPLLVPETCTMYVDAVVKVRSPFTLSVPVGLPGDSVPPLTLMVLTLPTPPNVPPVANAYIAIDGADQRERAAQHIPVLIARAGHRPVRIVDLVEGREAVILEKGTDQVEVERILADAAELEGVGASAEHQAIDDAAGSERQCVGAADTKLDCSNSGPSVDDPRVEDVGPAVRADADTASTDGNGAGIDDLVCRCERAHVDAKAGIADGDRTAVDDG